MQEAEIWLPIADTRGVYEVSDLGQVRSLPHVITLSGKRAGQTRHEPGQVLQPHPGHQGHLYVTIGSKADGTRRRRFVHHLVLETFVGPCPPGLECRHRDGNPANNRLGNLRWGTRAMNQRDAVNHGTHVMTRRTHCPYDHSLTMPNLKATPWEKKGERHCLACARARSFVFNTRTRRGVELDHKEWADKYYAEIMNGAA